MANAGTLLTDLDGKMPIAGDNDLVSMIYKDMNSGAASGPEMRPGGAIQMMPSPQTPHMNQMDTVPATAHIIGGQHPTAGDFAQMLQSSSTGFAPSAWGPGAQGQGQRQMTPEEFAAQVASMQAQQGKAWTGILTEELKLPVLIAILVFVVNMPFVSVLVSHYASWMLKSSGEMNLYGDVFKSLLVGALFWGANKILLPLLR